MRLALGLSLVVCPIAASAHGLFDHDTVQPASMLTAALLAVATVAYAFGMFRKPPALWRASMFFFAMLLTVGALFGPLDELAERSSAWHMGQHMLLMVLIAPLFVAAAPIAQWRSAFGRHSDVLWAPILRAGRNPMAAAVVHGAMIWFWHAPLPYMAAVQSPWLHALEHACFLFSAWLFWWAVLRVSWEQMHRALLALLFTLMHTGLLGALLVFSGKPFYGESRDLADQQLAGLIMWVPGGLAYLAAALWCGLRWFDSKRLSTA